MNTHVLSWFRALLAAIFGGAADGILIGLGGSAGVSAVTELPVSGKAIIATVAVNILLDVARFVKSNPDPWGFAAPAPVQAPPFAPAATGGNLTALLTPTASA
jgi:hypothetical protein